MQESSRPCGTSTPSQYRNLETGETTEFGDQFKFRLGDRDWIDCQVSIGFVVQPHEVGHYRRPLQPL